MKAVLCVGGLDPAGQAGLLADMRAVEAMGGRALCVATALTFQSPRGAEGYEPVPVQTVSRQLAPLLRDESIGAVKVGQLASAEVAALVGELPLDVPFVVDTPLAASSGAALFPLEHLAAYGPLIARSALVTPNAPEALRLAGHAPSDERERVEEAARALGARAVLLKGGHIAGDRVVDVLFVDGRRVELSGPRLSGRFRGTGCRLASAVAARLAGGVRLEDAVRDARSWLQRQLSGAQKAS